MLADAFAAGAQTCPGPPELDQRLVSLSKHARDATGRPRRSSRGLDRLTLTAQSLRSPLAFLTPVQATCNYVTLFLRNIGSPLSEQHGTGHRRCASRWSRSTTCSAARRCRRSTPVHDAPDHPTGEHGPLHVNPYPNTASPGQTAECAAGNEPYSGAAAADRQPPATRASRPRRPERPETARPTGARRGEDEAPPPARLELRRRRSSPRS